MISRSNHNHRHFISVSILLLFLSLSSSSSDPKVNSSIDFEKDLPPPLPILPLPSASQLRWQQGNMAMFIHFGPNTFSDSEWGSGHADPNTFNPALLNASQWAAVAREAGFSRVILTAKHHDGFCLWPSGYTDYSVRSSSAWRNGSGDVVGELAEAARKEGLGLGLYLSPWDRHEGCYGRTLDYNQFYVAQMTELLTRYGEIQEVWLDGAKGDGEKDMKYFFNLWFDLIHQLQPRAVIFSDAGPDTRWIGDEGGVAGSTCWSLFNHSDAKIGDTDPRYSQMGDPVGRDWVPAECDVSIRPGWFWHASEGPKSAKTLLDIYYTSAGRNCLMLLNVPPNSSGLISAEDVQVLREFRELRDSIFSNNLASNALVSASSTRGNGDFFSRFGPQNVLEEGIFTYWAPKTNQSADWVLYMDFQESVSFNVVKIQEPIQMGQRIAEFRVEILEDDGNDNSDTDWKKIANGTTVGYHRLVRFWAVKSRFMRLVIKKARAEPLVAYLGVYMDRVSNVSDYESGLGTVVSHFNTSQLVQSSVVNESQLLSSI